MSVSCTPDMKSKPFYASSEPVCASRPAYSSCPACSMPLWVATGSRAGAEQPAWPLCAGWPMPGLAMPHGQFPPFAPPGPFMPGTMHSTPSAFHNAALLRPAAACGTVSHCASGMSHPASSLPRAASTGACACRAAMCCPCFALPVTHGPMVWGVGVAGCMQKAVPPVC